MIGLEQNVTGLYRYPIKGFTPEAVGEVTLTPNSFFPFDRIMALEVGPSGYGKEEPHFINKMKYAVLARFACVAKMHTAYDDINHAFRLDDREFDLKSEAARHSLCRHVETVLAAHEDYDPIEMPLRLLDIAERHTNDFRFTDSDKGFVSLLNLNSVRDLEMRTGQTLAPERFRANIWLEGLTAFEDHEWVGRRLRLGEEGPLVEVLAPIKRCKATHVNPETAQSDFPVCDHLWAHYGHRNLGLYVRIIEGGRIII